MSMIWFMKTHNAVDCFEDSFVVDIHVKTSVAVVAVKIKHLTVHKVNSSNVHCQMTIAVVRQVKLVLSFPRSYNVNIWKRMKYFS